MEKHTFEPFRPGGRICIAEVGPRVNCGLTAEALVHREEAAEEMVGAPRYPEGTPEYDAYRDELRAELRKFAAGEDPYPYNTPAEERTGVSDRTAAALAALAELRADFGGRGVSARFDLIEAALRESGQR